MPKVSVIIPVYNGQKYIEESVNSILSQTFRDFEIIILNDASTDHTGDILKSFNDPRIRILTHEKRSGPSHSRNDAIEASSGEYIAIMDADDISVPRRLEMQVKFLDDHKDVVIVGSGWVEIDQDGTTLLPTYYPEDNETIQRILPEKNCFCHSSTMYRKSVFKQIGGYRTEFEVCEDYDLFLRFAELHGLHNLSDILCKHRLNPNSLSINMRKINQYHSLASTLARERRAGRPENLEAYKTEIVTVSAKSGVAKAKMHLSESLNRSFTLSRYYYGNGCYFLYKGHIKKARRLFGRCLRYNALHIRGLVWLFICCLPQGIVNAMVRTFQSARKSYAKKESKGT